MEKNEELEAYNKMLFYLIKDQAEQRAIIQQQQAQLEKYRKESVFRPLRKIKSLFQKEK